MSFFDSARRVSAGVDWTRRGGWEGSGEVCRLRTGASRAAASRREVCLACGRPCDAEEGAFHVMNFSHVCTRGREKLSRVPGHGQRLVCWFECLPAGFTGSGHFYV